MHKNEIDNEIYIDIYHMNISFLMLCQKMIEADNLRAQYYLGVSEKQMSQLRALTLPQLILLAGGSELLCKFESSDSDILEALKNNSL
ncbi:flagellar transcriptional regulator FlhD [Lelliottia amnigena]